MFTVATYKYPELAEATRGNLFKGNLSCCHEAEKRSQIHLLLLFSEPPET